jgi:hypothetical protein
MDAEHLNPYYSPTPSNLSLGLCVEPGKYRGFHGSEEGGRGASHG